MSHDMRLELTKISMADLRAGLDHAESAAKKDAEATATRHATELAEEEYEREQSLLLADVRHTADSLVAARATLKAKQADTEGSAIIVGSRTHAHDKAKAAARLSSKKHENEVARLSRQAGEWKTLSKQECVNGSPDVKQLAMNELKDVADLFEGSAPQQTTVPIGLCPCPRPCVSTSPSPCASPCSSPCPGGNGATGPLAKKPRVLSVIEQRRDRLTAAGSAGAAGDEAESGSRPSITHKVRVLQELTRYLIEGVELEEDGFSFPGFWRRRGSPKLSQATGEVIEEVAMPHLALLARLYHGVEATSCQAERNFFALALLIGNMRSSMGAFKVEQMMFLRLNQSVSRRLWRTTGSSTGSRRAETSAERTLTRRTTRGAAI
ncbi:unnamed protein product [Ascophyllum nodosum]